MRKTADQTKLGDSLQNTWPVLSNTVKKKTRKVLEAVTSQKKLRICGVHAPLSMEFSRQKYWNGLTFPFSGDPTQGSNPGLPEL